MRATRCVRQIAMRATCIGTVRRMVRHEGARYTQSDVTTNKVLHTTRPRSTGDAARQSMLPHTAGQCTRGTQRITTRTDRLDEVRTNAARSLTKSG